MSACLNGTHQLPARATTPSDSPLSSHTLPPVTGGGGGGGEWWVVVDSDHLSVAQRSMELEGRMEGGGERVVQG